MAEADPAVKVSELFPPVAGRTGVRDSFLRQLLMLREIFLNQMKKHLISSPRSAILVEGPGLWKAACLALTEGELSGCVN